MENQNQQKDPAKETYENTGTENNRNTNSGDVQNTNVTGQPQGDQGRASFSSGSATQGGSNFGQGSSHLGGESYQQGSRSNAGSNYENEADRIGSSSTGTNYEGSSSPGAGGGMTDTSAAQQSDSKGNYDQGNTGGYKNVAGANAEEREESDTALDRDSNMGEDESTSRGTDRAAGSWSQGTASQNDEGAGPRK